MTHIREIYGTNFRWQHVPQPGPNIGWYTIERYRTRLRIQSRGFYPGRYARVIR